MVEYRNLPQLVRAAAPDQLVLAWIDRPITPPGDLADHVVSLPAADAMRHAVRIAGEGFGLPFSAMLDANGRACAVWRGAIGPTDIDTLRARCNQPRGG